MAPSLLGKRCEHPCQAAFGDDACQMRVPRCGLLRTTMMMEICINSWLFSMVQTWFYHIIIIILSQHRNLEYLPILSLQPKLFNSTYTAQHISTPYQVTPTEQRKHIQNVSATLPAPSRENRPQQRLNLRLCRRHPSPALSPLRTPRKQLHHLRRPLFHPRQQLRHHSIL